MAALPARGAAAALQPASAAPRPLFSASSRRGACARTRAGFRDAGDLAAPAGPAPPPMAGPRRRQLLESAAGALLAGALGGAPPAMSEPSTSGLAPLGEMGSTQLLASEAGLSPVEKQVLLLNRRVQKQNYTPVNFPAFVRDGFNIKVLADGYESTPDGLIYKDFVAGEGEAPAEGQEVVFDYTGYNESGAVIDSTYRKGAPAQTRLGIRGLIPGFEMGIRSMRVGGKRRIVVPPELGPPVGPSTFFSAKQCEVFDVELRAVRTCVRRQVAMFSDVVCE